MTREVPTGRWGLLVAAAVLGVAGYFGPWIPHRAAGLVISGLDLAEYVKFLPEIMSGQITVRREVFYLPVIAGSLTAALLASRDRLSSPLRVLLLAAAVALPLAQLPPAWSPATLRLPEYRIQLLSIAICLFAVLLVGPARRVPDRAVLIGIGLLALGTTLSPAWSFHQVRPAIAAIYGASLLPGWGFWACLSGYLGLAFLGIGYALAPGRPRVGRRV